jgi:hypothetical protein
VTVYDGPLDRIPPQGVYWNSHRREAVVIVELSADDARALASGLPAGDAGARELEELADEADALWKQREGD